MSPEGGRWPAAVEDSLANLPRRPGVYIYRDAAGDPIYIGKAKSLRSRVRSYFQPSANHGPRIARMVREIANLELIVVDTEVEALILESNLIKKQRPRYNVVLRDDKHFPYLKLSSRDPYPRVSLVRKARRDGNVYCGPFLPASTARRSMKLVQKHFRVATCREIFDGKRRPCLYYHLDQCLAPCAGKTNEDEYGRAVTDARLFLEGRDTELRQSVERRMREASGDQRFEEAARQRDTLKVLDRLATRQRISHVGMEEQDYIAHHADGGQVAIQVFEVREGKVQTRREFTLENVETPIEELYATVLAQYYIDTLPPREVLLGSQPADQGLLRNWLMDRRGSAVRLAVPVRGPKHKFMEIVRRNARLAFDSRFRAHDSHTVTGLNELARIFGMTEPPNRIECFDISNIQGTDAVASMVVWYQGRPKKADYRSFNIRGVTGPDDFASIAEAVTRRYRRLIEESRTLPDLVLIDGGAGQLGAAVSALTAVGLPGLPVASLAKREEEIYLHGRQEPIRLDRHQPALQLLQRIRDEAHRFAVTHHRNRRRRRTLRTGLTDIQGIGPTLSKRLLTAFGSRRAVQEATVEQLSDHVGPRLAERIQRHFSS
ncbi:MAG: excinuclease ABC subunit UvrC [Acidobacteriota bacterium]|nr:excinuclease ABC subunit UvrC [Acidobacteriota bacterium]MDH3786543.1 excinuclease ABC subunit UvrC [Acidobacteriota bacterium]